MIWLRHQRSKISFQYNIRKSHSGVFPKKQPCFKIAPRCKATCKLQAATCKLQATACKLQATTCKLQATTCKLQATACKLQASTCKLQATVIQVQYLFLVSLD